MPLSSMYLDGSTDMNTKSPYPSVYQPMATSSIPGISATWSGLQGLGGRNYSDLNNTLGSYFKEPATANKAQWATLGDGTTVSRNLVDLGNDKNAYLSQFGGVASGGGEGMGLSGLNQMQSDYYDQWAKLDPSSRYEYQLYAPGDITHGAMANIGWNPDGTIKADYRDHDERVTRGENIFSTAVMAAIAAGFGGVAGSALGLGGAAAGGSTGAFDLGGTIGGVEGAGGYASGLANAYGLAGTPSALAASGGGSYLSAEELAADNPNGYNFQNVADNGVTQLDPVEVTSRYMSPQDYGIPDLDFNTFSQAPNLASSASSGFEIPGWLKAAGTALSAANSIKGLTQSKDGGPSGNGNSFSDARYTASEDNKNGLEYDKYDTSDDFSLKDLFNNLGSGVKSLTGLSIPQLLASLYSGIQGNKAKQGSQDLLNKITGSFGENSDYSNELRRQLERRDAASGRQSQYGPREVELQAKLAGLRLQALTSPSTLSLNNQANASNQGLNSLFGFLGQNQAQDRGAASIDSLLTKYFG